VRRPQAVVVSTSVLNYVRRHEDHPRRLSRHGGGDAFAYLTVEGRPHVFIGVLADSGM
jgi:hypothetical protein